MKRILLIVTACLFVFSGFSQIPVGSWRTHLSYNNITKVLDTPDAVYALSTKDFSTGNNGTYTKNNGALFVYHKEEESVETLSKIVRLNESLCSNMEYSPSHNTVILAYENSNIDLIIDNRVYNIPDLKLKDMNSNKKINGISVHNDIAYFATDFGIVTINMLRREFIDMVTFSAGGGCNYVIVLNNYIYGFYKTGVWRCDISDNMMDISKWQNLNRDVNYTSAQIIDGKICAFTSYGIDSFDPQNNTWTLIHNRYDIKSFTKVSDGYLIADSYSVNLFNDKHQHQCNISLPEGKTTSASSFIKNTIWVANSYSGISCYQIKDSSSELIHSNISVNGPSLNGAFRMRTSNDKILAVAGGWFQKNYSIRGEFYIFEDEEWKTINTSKCNPSLNLSNAQKMDFSDIIEDPNQKNHYYVAAWQDGLYEFIGDSVVNLWKKENSNNFINDLSIWKDHYHLMALAAHDKRIWFANYLTSNGTIKSFKKIDDGISLFPNYSLEWIDALVFTRSGNIWANNLRTGEIHVFSTGETLDNPQDDIAYNMKNYFMDQDNNTIGISNAYSMVLDRKNNIWLGHDKGVLVISNPDANLKDVISGNTSFRISRIKVPRNDGTNNADYLLDGTKAYSIAVDGANRKWIGTGSNGVYLVSESGTEVLANFTQDNSPILGNHIEAIAIIPKTGEVFFSTDNGICSFRADATAPQNSFKQVEVFPNPVRPDYSGLISINGLRDNSFVRITDINGNSVNEGRSKGGLYTWNGLNHRGNGVATGVYLVYASSSDGQDGVVAKIMIVK